MKIAYLIHGIKTREPGRSTISFLKHLLPMRTVILGYGYIPAILAPLSRLVNFFVVRRLSSKVQPGQILIGHSNGCAIAYRLSQKLYTTGLVLVNPALDSDVEFDKNVRFIHIYWSRNDRVTWLSKFVPFSDWGSMGNVGYKGLDPRVRQWEMGISHTDIGDVNIAAVWGPIIVANLMEELNLKVHPISN